MRAFLLAFLLGCDPYPDVEKANTIEGYEAYLQEHPTSTYKPQAEARLATLRLEKARAAKTLEAYDEFIEKHPNSSLVKDALKERKEFLWAWADEKDTVESWQRYIDEYSRPDKEGGDRKGVSAAKKRQQMAKYKDSLEIGPVEMEMVNLAEDPDGPLNGYGFYADVKNVGNKPITSLRMRIQYLDAAGDPVGDAEWPLVASRLPGGLPIEEGFDKPVRPGETRTWKWTTGDLPDGWAKKTKLTAVDIRVEGDDAKDGDEKGE